MHSFIHLLIIVVDSQRSEGSCGFKTVFVFNYFLLTFFFTRILHRIKYTVSNSKILSNWYNRDLSIKLLVFLNAAEKSTDEI